MKRSATYYGARMVAGSCVKNVVFAAVVIAALIAIVCFHTGSIVSATEPQQQNRDEAVADLRPEIAGVVARIIAAVDARDAAQLNAVIDWSSVIETATSSPVDTLRVAGARLRFRKRIDADSVKLFAQPLIVTVQNGGKYRFVRTVRRGSETRLLFRRWAGDGDSVPVSFDEWCLAATPANSIVTGTKDGGKDDGGKDGGGKQSRSEYTVVDVLPYSRCEPLSETVRRAYAGALYRACAAPGDAADQAGEKSIDKPAGDKTGADKPGEDRIATLDQLTQQRAVHEKGIQLIRRLIAEGKPDEALAAILKLPVELQGDTDLCLLRVNVAVQQGDAAEMESAVMHLVKSIPESPWRAFFLGTVAVVNVDASAAEIQWSVMGDEFANDPAIAFMRGVLADSNNDFAAAAAAFGRVAASEPTYATGCTVWMISALRARAFDQVVAAMRLLRDECHEPIAGYESDPLFKEFVTSPEFIAWKKKELEPGNRAEEGNDKTGNNSPEKPAP